MKSIDPSMNPAYVSATAVPLHAYATCEPILGVPENTSEVNQSENAIREFLGANQWPLGLQDLFIKNLTKISYRFFICDDSGSMSSTDGNKLISDNYGGKRLISCSRWSELTQALRFHADLARVSNCRSEFRLLNNSVPIVIDTLNDSRHLKHADLMDVLESSPSGNTPLCRHIREVIAQIRQMEQSLRATGTKALVMIATDGQSSDGNIAQAMRPLKDLPVWVVVRLCTDDSGIVNYWNNIDAELELNMDVLDDHCGEANEIYQNNKWLAYGEPLHRLREFGILVKEFDLLDECRLSNEQIRNVCAMIFGISVERIPHPEADWSKFIDVIVKQNKLMPPVWNPIFKKNTSWIDTNNLKDPTACQCVIC